MTKILIGLAGGFAVGVIFTAIIYRISSSSGTLKIDHSNPEKDVYRFEIDDLDSLSKKKSILMKIDNHADLSQK